MPRVLAVEGHLLARIVDSMAPSSREGLNAQAYTTWCSALSKTAWGREGLRRWALVDGPAVLACAEESTLSGVLDGRAVRVCGIGALFTNPRYAGLGHAQALATAILERATGNGADLALLFAHDGLEADAREGFLSLPLHDFTLLVADPARRGAPMTMVRGGEERDLQAIVAMGRTRAAPMRFHLDRDIDFVQYATTRKRLLAGLGVLGARELHFFIAEEGITAAAYVVVSAVGDTWILEECGDRDPSGARVGALLQALIAREPVERRPTIRGWLPPGFRPPQVTVESAAAAAEALLLIRGLGSAVVPAFATDDVLYWRNDAF